MKNPNVLCAATIRSAVVLSACALSGALLAGCGEDPILIAEIIASREQASSSDPSSPQSDSDETPTAAPEDETPTDPVSTEPEYPVDTDPTDTPQAAPQTLEEAAVDVLIRHCGDCHLAPTPEEASADLNYIDDFEQLVDNGQVEAGDRDNSRVYIRMVNGTMPPLTISPMVPFEEIEIVGAYIDTL